MSKRGVEGPDLLRGSICQALGHFVCREITTLNVEEIQKKCLNKYCTSACFKDKLLTATRASSKFELETSGFAL